MYIQNKQCVWTKPVSDFPGQSPEPNPMFNLATGATASPQNIYKDTWLNLETWLFSLGNMHSAKAPCMFHGLWKENEWLQTDYLWHLCDHRSRLTSSVWHKSTTPGLQNRALCFSLDSLQMNISTADPFCISNVGVACCCTIGCAASDDLGVREFVIGGGGVSVALWGSFAGSDIRRQEAPKFGLFMRLTSINRRWYLPHLVHSRHWRNAYSWFARGNEIAFQFVCM